MEGVRAVCGTRRPNHIRERHVVQERIVTCRSGPPPGNHVFPVGKLHVEQGGLQSIEAGVEPHFEVVVFALGPVVGKAPYPRGQVGVGSSQPSVAERTEVLLGKSSPHRPSMPAGPDAWAAPHGTEASISSTR